MPGWVTGNFFFSRLKVNVSCLRRPGAVRAQPCSIFQFDELSNLYTDENNFERNSKLFSFMFVYWAFYTFYWLKSLKYFIQSK